MYQLPQKPLGPMPKLVYGLCIAGTRCDPGAGGREMRELPPAKEEEHHVQRTHPVKSIDLSPQGIDLPRFGRVREIRDGSRAVALHEPLVADPCRQRRLARRSASASARAVERAVGGAGTLVSRFQSSPHLAARSDANFGIE